MRNLLPVWLLLLALNAIAHNQHDQPQGGSSPCTELIVVPKEESIQFLRNTLAQAKRHQIPLSIRGVQHSQGGAY